MAAAAGAVARYRVSGAAAHLLGTGFPYGTLIVNVAGSFPMGVLTEVLALVRSAGMEARLFMVAGGPGAFTAFSTFLPDFVALYERGRWLLCAVYVVASVVPSIGAPFAGLHVMRRALGPTI